ncbi:ATP-binding cassette domain-containing protein [Streptomyces sp. NPDC094032]|uniref:ABC transporter ATP-binding protein n=1 Tax=Streptomyces sp. NPDC094032 TaxID=3155308 RepID=UPI00331CDD6D
MRITDLTVRYGSRTVVKGLDLEIPPASVVGLVGESGSGKSTVARAITGLVPYQGTIEGPDRRKVQMVFQDPYGSLDPRMRVGSSIAEGLADRLSRAQRAAEVERLLSLVSLAPQYAGRYPRELSGGQRQRVAIARALGTRPELLIADEITSALDVSVQGSVLNLIRSLQAELGLSLLFISHNLAVVRYVCDRVAVMHRGRLVEEGPVEEVMAAPSQAYTRALLDAVPRPATA